jgi:uncharacterized protein
MSFFSDADKDIQIRYFYTHIQPILSTGFDSITEAQGVSKADNDAFVFAVNSEGDIHINDTLRVSNDPTFTPTGNVKNITLSEAINSWQMQKFISVNNTLPSACSACTLIIGHPTQ